MPERERKQKQAPEKRVEEEVDVAAPAKQGEELKEELDDLLDEIDSVLEANAGVREKLCTKGRWSRSYVQSVGVTPLLTIIQGALCKKCGESKPSSEVYRAAAKREWLSV